MSDNEIKPVAWVDLECWKATNDAGESFFTDYQDEETVALYEQSAIDALTNQISELKTMLSIAEFQRKEMQAERDEANRKLSVAVADGKALVADAERYRKIEALAAGTPEQWCYVEDAAFASHWGNARNFSLNIDAIGDDRAEDMA